MKGEWTKLLCLRLSEHLSGLASRAFSCPNRILFCRFEFRQVTSSALICTNVISFCQVNSIHINLYKRDSFLSVKMCYLRFVWMYPTTPICVFLPSLSVFSSAPCWPLWYYWSLERQGLYPHLWGWKLWNLPPADLSPPSDWQTSFSQSASVYRHTSVDKPRGCPSTTVTHGACLWCFRKQWSSACLRHEFEHGLCRLPVPKWVEQSGWKCTVSWRRLVWKLPL